jgi:hypothetical protein
LVSSAEVVPMAMGVATAKSGDVKIAWGRANDHGILSGDMMEAMETKQS